jgi:hypothetical protein
MKTHVIAISVLVAMLVLPVSLHAQETDPGAVVSATQEAFNSGDVDAMMALFTDDAVVNLAFFDETYSGAEEIRAWFEELAADNFEIQIEVLQVDGDKVYTETTTWSDFTRELGIAPLVATEVYTVEGDKIKGFTWTPTDESVDKLMEAMSASLPETGGVSFPSYALAMALGGLVILSGCGLALLRRRSP